MSDDILKLFRKRFITGAWTVMGVWLKHKLKTIAMHKIFEIIMEVVGWLQIVLSPTLIGMAIGFGIYYNYPDLTGLVCGIVVACMGLLIGILWATKKFKTTGTLDFLSRISATPELDNKKSDKNSTTEKKANNCSFNNSLSENRK